MDDLKDDVPKLPEQEGVARLHVAFVSPEQVRDQTFQRLVDQVRSLADVAPLVILTMVALSPGVLSRIAVVELPYMPPK